MNKYELGWQDFHKENLPAEPWYVKAIGIGMFISLLLVIDYLAFMAMTK